jgi:T5SS/PEP-CTERM-associated repeat protein
MAASTWTWLGKFADTDTPADWSLDSGPGSPNGVPVPGDTVIFTGAGVPPQLVDQQFTGGTVFELTGTGTVQFLDDQGGFSNVSTIDSSITINAEGTAASILAAGTFTNGGTVEVTGTGNALTINIASDVTNSTTQTGWFENDGSIVVGQGDSLTIAAASGGTIAGFGTVFVDGGSALIDAALANFSMEDNFAISQGGSLEIENSGTSAQPNITFNGDGVLKIDQPAVFGGTVINSGSTFFSGGTISNFALGDTIDLVGVTNVASVVYDGNGDIFLMNSDGATLFAANAQGGDLGGNNSTSFPITGTGGIAGDIIVTEGGGNTTITATPPRTWLWTPGLTGSADTSTNWTVVAGPPGTLGPNQGDTAINADGTVVADGNINLKSNTVELGGTSSVAAFIITNTQLGVPGGSNNNGGGNGGGNGGNGNGGGDNGNSPISFQSPSIDNNSEITSDVQSAGTFTGNTTAEQTLLGSAGYFVNEGTIDADGPAGSSFTLAITGTTVIGTNDIGTLLPGYFINYNQIDVAAGNSMTITVDGTSELYNAGVIRVDGGSLLFDAAAGALDGGFAGGDGSILISGGGTVETNSSYPSNSNATSEVYAFADETSGNTLKIDNLGSFGGSVLGFAQGDTIDLGSNLILSISTVVYSATTGILNLENNSGTIVGSLLIGSGHFQSGTFATTLSGLNEIAGSFTFSLGTDGDTLLTTNALDDVFDNTSGSWQADGLWSNGAPVTLNSDVPIIGAGASSPFTLTTGTSPLVASSPIMEGGLLQITSSTTFAPAVARQFGGTIEVTSGNSLTATELAMFGGTFDIDPTGSVDITGHNVDGTTGAISGTIAASNSNTRAVLIGSGDLLVNGGVLDAAPLNSPADPTGQHGGDFLIGYEGGGLPATVTVQNNGADDGVVTGSYTQLGSDPTSFGVLTLNGGGVSGGATWTDEIDASEPTTETTGFMEIGQNVQATLTGTVTPAPFTNDATLQIENGATLTDQSYAIIGQSEDSGGSVDVSNGLWNVGTGPDGGFLNVGNSATSTGTLEVDGGGTVAVLQGGTFFNEGTTFTGSGLNIGNHADSTGTLIVQDGGLITDEAGLQVGLSGTGTAEVLNGGTIELTGTSAVNVGDTAGAQGSLLVSGESSSPSLLSASNGLNIGLSGQGQAQLLNGGTISVTGTSSVIVGLSAGGSGTLQIGGSGAEALLTMSSTTRNLDMGTDGSVTPLTGANGTIEVESNGSIQMNGTGAIFLGPSAAATGFLVVNGPNAAITAGNATTGMFIAGGAGSTGSALVENGGSISLNGTASSSNIIVGQSTGAQGTLDIESGGTVLYNSPGNILIGQNAGANGLAIVNGAGAALQVGTTSSPTAALGLAVGNGGSGTLEVEDGGTLSFNSTNGGLRDGNSANGFVEVTGTGSTLSFDTPNNPDDVGNGSTGTLEVLSGGSATFNNTLGIGVISAASSGVVTVSGTGSTLTDTGSKGQINVGGPGTGSLNIDAGGSVSATAAIFIANISATSQGTITVNAGTLTDGGQLAVGNAGTGTLNIQTGGLVQLTGINGVSVGFNSGASGDVSINGGMLSDANGFFTIANTGATGTLTIGAGGSLLAQSLNENSGGTIGVSGGGAELTTNNGLNVGGGSAGSASMTIGAGGGVFANGNGNASNMSIGSGASGDSGTVTVTTGGSLVADGMIVGSGGTGTLTVNAGASVTNTSTSAIGLGGFGVGGSGTVIVDGATMTDDGGFMVGNTNASGTLLVDHGGTLTSSSGGFAFAGQIGAAGSGTGAVTVSAATWNANGQLLVGGGEDSLDINSFGLVNTGTNNVNIGGGTAGAGTISLESGGSLNAGFIGLDIGPTFGGTGLLSIDGGTVTALGLNAGLGGSIEVSGGSLSVSGQATIGQAGSGAASLTQSGGVVSTGDLAIGQNTTSSGTVTVSGGSLTATGEINIGAGGNGTATIDGGGTMSAVTPGPTSPAVSIGSGLGTTGGLTVSGTGSALDANGAVVVGGNGLGSLDIANAATVESGNPSSSLFEGVDAGQMSGGSGAISVTGTQSLLTNTGEFVVGDNGTGSLTIDAGGTVVTTPAGGGAGLAIANTSNADGSSVNLSGAGSNLQITGLLDVGVDGSGGLSISDGALVTAGTLDAGNISSAVANINVSGADFTVTGDATVADDGTGVMSVLSGATFTAGNLTIGNQGDSSGAMVVSGDNTVVNISGDLNVGTSVGTGDLTIGPGATVNASVVNLQGEVVLENGELDPTVNLINQGQTAGGSGTIAAGDIVDEGVIQAGGSKPSQKLLVVAGTILGGGPWAIDSVAQFQANGGAGILQINAGGTMEVTGPVLNAASTTFTDDVTPQSTYTVNDSVVDVNFGDATGVLKLDDIGGFAGTIAAFRKGDSFVITGGTLSNLGVTAGNTLTVSDSGNGGTDHIIFGSGISTSGFNIVNNNTIQVACFAAGTRIATDTGPVSVERLRVGDRAITAEAGACEPIVWIGQRTVNCRAHPKPETVWPVRVSAGAFGENVPVRDLYLSPDHAVFVNGALVPVKLLINGTTIARVKRDRVTYYHVELPRHAIILAESLTVESYLELGDRTDFNGASGVVRLFPDFTARLAPDTAMVWETKGAAPLVMAGEKLNAARRMVVSGPGPSRQPKGSNHANHRRRIS